MASDRELKSLCLDLFSIPYDIPGFMPRVPRNCEAILVSCYYITDYLDLFMSKDDLDSMQSMVIH